ncbi:tyrosine-type recombinase/integrase [Halovenus sp. WSH3]|uniref:Tyrosine-type recombinase/integrase n=1 Tax=Halovenus carboxidivorans TaxID=2692199 RepID=A0A6B0T2U3_9EURY|nr:site-specific integrase [Halovenus carboxidivorans]MXR52315.1 tyrosine-type recombinase/integrase [Halovenus carboxidivorans]
MRIEATKADNETKVWLTDSEIEDLRRAAASYRDDVIIQLGAYVGLRAFEIPQVTPSGISTTDSGQYRLRVPRGKDTTGSGGKPRDAYLPPAVERDLQQFQNAENIAPNDPFVELTERGVRAAVKRTAEAAAERTGNDDFEHISSHDLRRRFAQRLLVDEDLNPRIVMQVGGWDSFAAIEPYLNSPTEGVVDDEFASVDVV